MGAALPCYVMRCIYIYIYIAWDAVRCDALYIYRGMRWGELKRGMRCGTL